MYSITNNKEFIVSTINIILVGKNEENREKNSKLIQRSSLKTLQYHCSDFPLS